MSKQNKLHLYHSFSIKRWALIIIDIIGLIYLMVIFLLYTGTQPVDKNDDTIVSVVILHDNTLSTVDNLQYISEQLKDAGVIKSKTAFFIKSFLVGEFYNYKEGEYDFSPNMSVSDIIGVFAAE